MGRHDQIVEAKHVTIEGKVRYPGIDVTLESDQGDSQVIFIPSGTSQSIAIPIVINALKRKRPGTKWDWKSTQKTVREKNDLGTKDIVAGVYWIDDNPGITYNLD